MNMLKILKGATEKVGELGGAYEKASSQVSEKASSLEMLIRKQLHLLKNLLTFWR